MMAFFDPGSILEPTLVQSRKPEGYQEQGFHEKTVWSGSVVKKFWLFQHGKDLVRVPCWDQFLRRGVLEELTSGQEGEFSVRCVDIEAVE